MSLSPFSRLRGTQGLTPWYYAQARRKHPRAVRITSIVAGTALTAVAAYAATNWTVGLTGGSSGQAQSATVSNLSIAAVASPSPTNLLFPGGNGDVVATITNGNAIPVTITGLTIPANTSAAAGFSNSTLTTAQTGCNAVQSLVTYKGAGASPVAETLTTPVTVAASGTLTVVLTNDASMGTASPAACENTYFQMPAFTAVAATAGAATASSSPATTGW